MPLFWQQIQVLRSWPVRQAQVLRSQVVTQPAAKHDQLYAATIQIVYVLNGQPVTAELTRRILLRMRKVEEETKELEREK